MKLLTPALLALTGFLLLIVGAPAADQPKPQPTKTAKDDGQDFVFLGESRPVLVRLHVRVDGRSLETAWNECIDYLFHYLDVNNDGVLSKEELERGPAAEQFTGGGLGSGLFVIGRGAAPTGLTMQAVDTDGDGKVTRIELGAYYRKKGFSPFQFNLSTEQSPFAAYAFLFGGGRGEPAVDAVSKAIFDHLDTNKTGKLSLKELEAATTVLLKLDENEDEIVSTRELVPNAPLPDYNKFGAMMAMGGKGSKEKPTSNPQLVPVLTPGEVPADLANRMLKRYGVVNGEEKAKLSQKDLGLDEATFRQLDTDGDGVLDAKELGGFVKRTPDIEFILRLGKKNDTEAQLEVVTGDGRSPLADKCQVHEMLGLLDLGMTRVELLHSNQYGADRITLMRQDYLVQFRQADANGDGVVDADEAKGNQRLNRLFKVMDRDGDGKLTQKKLDAYFDHLQELEKKVAAGSVALSISDQSRGLFDLLDTNRDGRLSVREMRQAPKLLKQFDRGHKGYLTREDLPRTYRLDMHPVSFNLNDGGGAAAVVELYSSAYESEEAGPAAKGPLWFRKMDRNRDGDVSRKEWLYSEELFRQIDTDGDGLISVEEAEKADALFRKETEKKQR